MFRSVVVPVVLLVLIGTILFFIVRFFNRKSIEENREKGNVVGIREITQAVLVVGGMMVLFVQSAFGSNFAGIGLSVIMILAGIFGGVFASIKRKD